MSSHLLPPKIMMMMMMIIIILIIRYYVYMYLCLQQMSGDEPKVTPGVECQFTGGSGLMMDASNITGLSEIYFGLPGLLESCLCSWACKHWLQNVASLSSADMYKNIKGIGWHSCRLLIFMLLDRNVRVQILFGVMSALSCGKPQIQDIVFGRSITTLRAT